jgi:hypothetical protein
MRKVPRIKIPQTVQAMEGSTTVGCMLPPYFYLKDLAGSFWIHPSPPLFKDIQDCKTQ